MNSIADAGPLCCYSNCQFCCFVCCGLHNISLDNRSRFGRIENTEFLHSDFENDGKILRVVSEINYLSSILTTDPDINKATACSCKKIILAIVKLRAALVSGKIRLKTKCQPIEIRIKVFFCLNLK